MQPLKHGDPEWKGEGQDGLRALHLGLVFILLRNFSLS